jgi:phosphoribosylpyrophosphate synthetase
MIMLSRNGACVLFASGAEHFGLDDEVDFYSGTFKCGETSVQYLESVRGKHVIIVQSFHNASTNNQLMELLLLVDAANRAGADEVTVILPYFPYGRQDRKPDAGTPISERVICDMLRSVHIGFTCHTNTRVHG